MSNTATTTGTGFEMERIKGFLDEINSSGEDILQNAAEIEKMLEAGFDWILEADRLSEMKTALLRLFEELLSKPDFIDKDALDKIVDALKEAFKKTFGVVPSFDMELREALPLLKKLLPEKLGAIDLEDLKKKVDPIIDALSGSDFDFQFLQDNPALSAVLGNPNGSVALSGKTPVRERGKSSPQTATQAGKLDQSLTTFFASKPVEEVLDALPEKIEAAIAKSGIILELEEQLIALKHTLTNTKPLTLDLLMSELAGMARTLGPAAISLLKEILQIITDSMKSIYEAIRNIGADIRAEIGNLLDMLNLGEMPSPGIFTLPAVLCAIPLTLVRKAANKPGRLEFPSAFTLANDDFDFFTDKWIYASTQVADGLSAAGFGIVEARNKDLEESKGYVFGKGLVEITINTLGQLTNVPEQYHRTTDPNDEPQNRWILERPVWWWQWFVGVFWPLLNLSLSLSMSKDRLKKFKFYDALFKCGFGMINVAVAGVSVSKDNNNTEPKSDKRLEGGSFLDLLPGLIDAVCSLITMGREPFSDPAIHCAAIVDVTAEILDAQTGEEKKINDAFSAIINNPHTENKTNTLKDIKFFDRLTDFMKRVNDLKSAIKIDSTDEYVKVLSDCQKLQEAYQKEWKRLEDWKEEVVSTMLWKSNKDDSGVVFDSIIIIRQSIPRIRRELYTINQGIENLKKIESQKSRKAKREDNKALTYIPIISTLILKGTCAGLNFSTAANPAPEIESITPDPGNSLHLTATLKQINGEFNDAANINITWEKQEAGKWILLENTNADKKTITVTSVDLKSIIRAKCTYAHGYVTKIYKPK